MASSVQDDFKKRVAENTKKLVDSYATLLRLAKLGEDRDDVADRTYTPQSSDSLEILSASANIVHSCQLLLERVHELKLQVLLQDFAGIDQEVDEQHQVLNERRDQLQDEVSRLLQECSAGPALDPVP